RAERTGTRRARVDGRRPLERGHRTSARRAQGDGGAVRAQRPPQADADRCSTRPPAHPCRAHISRSAPVAKPSRCRGASIIPVMTTPAATTRVVLADDDVLLREGLASLLERSGFEIVGQSDNPRQLLELVDEQRPDLAIVDIRMPPTHTTEGLDAARQIREHSPETARSEEHTSELQS